jgi:tRNA(His) 5'-end guanylyltransferase
MTSAFNQIMLRLLATFKYRPEELMERLLSNKLTEIEAVFDARVFVIPDFREISNYMIWRQQDCTRNSITMAAGSVYSHKELHGKSGEEKQEMLFQKGINWNNYTVKYKRGIVIKKTPYAVEGPNGEVVMRSKWLPDYNTPVFTQDREYLYSLIPTITVEK